MDAMTKMAECGINACRALNMKNTAETIVVLLEQRAELLEALKRIACIPNKDIGSDWEEIEEARVIAADAITRAEAAE